VRQVGWWLEHEEERSATAEAGYRRVRAEHTYDHRFAEIFERIGLR
jgi:spore maturation protein CgeB